MGVVADGLTDAEFRGRGGGGIINLQEMQAITISNDKICR